MLSVEDDVCVGGVTGVKPGGSQATAALCGWEETRAQAATSWGETPLGLMLGGERTLRAGKMWLRR